MATGICHVFQTHHDLTPKQTPQPLRTLPRGSRVRPDRAELSRYLDSDAARQAMLNASSAPLVELA